jgi:hypothetical protein
MDEALALIEAKAAEKSNSFKVKVHRRIGLAAPLQHIASLEEATVEHLANPEQWLPALCGGGPIFTLAVCHASETVPNITFNPPNLSGAPRDIDPNIVKDPAWKGPTSIIYPNAAAKAQPAATGTTLESIVHLLGAPTTTPGSGTRGQDPKVDAGGSPGVSAEVLRRLDAEAVVRALAEAQKSTAAALADIRRETMEAVKAVAASVAVPPKSIAQQLAELAPVIATVAPLFVQMLSAGREATAAREAAQREEMARQREQADKARDEMMKLLAAGNERAAASSGDIMKMVTPMVESVSVMGKTMLQQVATMRELSSVDQPPSEWVEIAKAGLGALAEVLAAKAAASPGAPPKQLAAPRPPPPAPAQPAQGVPETDVAAVEDAEHAQQIEYLKTASVEEILKHTEDAIKGEVDAEELAEAFLDAIQVNPAVAAEVQKAGGPLQLFRVRIGDEWLKAHLAYAQALVSALTNAAKERQGATS